MPKKSKNGKKPANVVELNKAAKVNPTDAKDWKSLTIEEKMERAATSINNIQLQLTNLSKLTLKVRNQLAKHTHAEDGSVMVKMDAS